MSSYHFPNNRSVASVKHRWGRNASAPPPMRITKRRKLIPEATLRQNQGLPQQRTKTRSYDWAHGHKDQVSPAKKEEQRPAQSQWEWATMRCQTWSWLSHRINPLIAVLVALWGTWCCWVRDQWLGRTQEEHGKTQSSDIFSKTLLKQGNHKSEANRMWIWHPTLTQFDQPFHKIRCYEDHSTTARLARTLRCPQGRKCQGEH